MVAALAPAGQAAGQPGEVTVSAASSLADVLQQLAAMYEQRSGERIVLNFGASNTLARQIVAGAKVDLFISADHDQMDLVSDQILPGTRADLLSNQLAIAVPDDRPRRFSSARELADPAIRRLALGDPSAVPAGVYAKTYLQKIGLWDVVSPKVVPAGSVRLALAAVENGAADAAIVYRTDIATARRTVEAFVVPITDGPRIRYPVAALRAAPNAAGANRFLGFLQSSEAARVFERAGFGRP